MTEKLIYANPLSCEDDVKGFVMEGSAKVSFPNNKMRLENAMDPNLGQKSNFVFWCPIDFPSNLRISWNFCPLREPGLAILFFSALGINGEDIFDSSLAIRDGQYNLYHSGDINAYHVSYFRRKWDEERAFHTCNLRKSKGFYLVAQGADPIPNTEDVMDSYKIEIVKYNGKITFTINELPVFKWTDDGKEYGSVLKGGKIGFRQMAPLIAEYSDLKVWKLSE